MVESVADFFRANFQAHRIGKGERVMLWGENCAEWVAAFFGCAMRGVVVVPMDNGAAVDFASRVSRQVEAKAWACSRRNAQHCANSDGATAPVFVLDDLSKGVGNSPSPLVSHVALDRNDILQIVF